MTTVLRRYREVIALLPDPRQLRTGSDFETRSLACVERLRPLIGDLAERDAAEVTFEQQERSRDPVLWIPPMTILGEAGPGWPFHLLCWNEANSLVEGVQTPYRAARHIATEAYHNPDDPFGLIPPMTELAERYEDQASTRKVTAADIRTTLSDFLSRAPWPISDSCACWIAQLRVVPGRPPSEAASAVGQCAARGTAAADRAEEYVRGESSIAATGAHLTLRQLEQRVLGALRAHGDRPVEYLHEIHAIAGQAMPSTSPRPTPGSKLRARGERQSALRDFHPISPAG
ncbi:hypothetical protein [Pseudonocardia adelaidensis]